MRIGSIARSAILLSALLVLPTLTSAPAASADRLFLRGDSVKLPEEVQIEGACGAAFDSEGELYVSDYYHHTVDVFKRPGGAQKFPGDPYALAAAISGGAAAPEGPCGLATDPEDRLYVNVWHHGVVRLLPSFASFDSDESTGVAVDQESGDVYVDDRTHVAVYKPSGAPVLDGGEPLQIGFGSLEDAYGVAVGGGRVYVPDAADDTVKVFEPAVDPVNPAAVIDGSEIPAGGFTSLVDASVAVDPTNQHLLVLDNLQPGAEHPEAAIDEFDAAGVFLGRLPKTVIDGEPSGLAFWDGGLFVTSGNDEEANVVAFGPYVEPGAETVAPLAGPPPPALATSAANAPPGPDAPHHGGKNPAASISEVVQRGNLRVSFDGKLTPHALPRHGAAPVRVAVAARIASVDGDPPPQLRQIAIAINRNGHFTPRGLPVCHLRQIQPSTTANALKACRSSLVGQGHFSAKILLAQQAPFPSQGKVFAFNGMLHGKPAIFAHVYGTDPVPTSYTLPFAIEPGKGTYGTVLRASLPGVTGNSGYITGLSLNLGRSFSNHGRRHSYLSAGCPAPAGFPGAVFPFARASFGFKGRAISSVLTRSCKVGR